MSNVAQMDRASAEVSPGVRLHYTDDGEGPPLIFVHGGCVDMDMWRAQIAPFSQRYRVITYSRRYNHPNRNAPIDGYSAETDAEDLLGLIKALALGRVFVIGHSYGALTTLFLMVRHPGVVQAACLGEPPAVPLLRQIAGEGRLLGRAMYDEVHTRLTAPLRAAYLVGGGEASLTAFFDYNIGPGGWQFVPPSVCPRRCFEHQRMGVILPRGVFFPELGAEEVAGVTTPVLLLSGGRSPPYVAMIDGELERRLPNRRRVIYPDAGHVMWAQEPEACLRDTLQFFAEHGGPAAA